jgi:hypothetical protein
MAGGDVRPDVDAVTGAARPGGRIAGPWSRPAGLPQLAGPPRGPVGARHRVDRAIPIRHVRRGDGPCDLDRGPPDRPIELYR